MKASLRGLTPSLGDFRIKTGRLLHRNLRGVAAACRPAAAALAVSLCSLGAPSTARAEVTPTGAYTTGVGISVPPAPGAPILSLNYNSASGLGIAGVGWDLSVGWPTLIARDTRFGTPQWDASSPWVWGNLPLVSTATASSSCDPLAGPCSYRTAPDSLAKVEMDLRTTDALAAVELPNGTVLIYEPVRYDGTLYPTAPAGAKTDVFGFLLRNVKAANGYLTCFVYTHHANNNDANNGGRVAVLSEILYSPTLKTCDNPPVGPEVHRVSLRYDDPVAKGYFAPMSFRFGAPVSFNNLLKTIDVHAGGAAGPVQQARYELIYQEAMATETRQPRLKRIVQTTIPGGAHANAKTRTLRQFAYGDRKPSYDPKPMLIDVGADARDFPASLAGSVTRPVRQPFPLANPYGLFGRGNDQNDDAAPPAHAVTRQWSFTDINGDGLNDTVVADERGPRRFPFTWATYETDPDPGPRPPQQYAFISQGIKESSAGLARKAMGSDKVMLKTDTAKDPNAPPPLDEAYSPEKAALGGSSRWIWLEGRGMTRIGMPVSVSSPELRDGGDCGQSLLSPRDTRLWPYLPDGSLGGSEGSVGATIGAARRLVFDTIEDRSGNPFPIVEAVAKIVRGIDVPRHSVTATLSGWLDLDGDGTLDFVITPGMIQRFDRPATCNWRAHRPSFPEHPRGTLDTSWYIAPGTPDPRTQGGPAAYDADRRTGPPGPVGLPLSFSVESGHSDGWGLTIPVGSLLSTGASALSTGIVTPQTVASIIMALATPRGDPGISANVHVNVSSASAINHLYGLAVSPGGLTAGNVAAAAAGFLKSSLGISLDVTLKTGGNRGRSQSTLTTIDFNADGYPDSLLYNTVGTSDAARRPGDIVLYLNDGRGGFSGPQRVNAGHEYSSMPPIADLEWAANDTENIAFRLQNIEEPICQSAFLVDPRAAVAPCAPFVIEAVNLAAAADKAVTAAAPFLRNSTDALPSDKARTREVAELADALRVSTASLMVLGPSPINKIAQHVAKTTKLLEQTVKQLAYPSRLNALGKGMSYLQPAWVGSDAGGIVVQTGGLVDLNRDLLPDYVVTTDREKGCGKNQWAVYWGTGTSSLTAGRGFTASPTCIDVPASPFSRSRGVVVGVGQSDKIRGYDTLPLQADIHWRPGRSILEDTTRYNAYSFVTLMDYNQDGAPDLLVVQGDRWDPHEADRRWRVYLNSGRGFDLARPLTIRSVGGRLPGVLPASAPDAGSELGTAYPGLKSGFHDSRTQVMRSGADVDVTFTDVDGDGTSDIARRVWHSRYTPRGETLYRAGIVYWSRAGAAPQDLMIEERDPLGGSRTLVSYRPASHFQWPEGVPDGNAPPGGHRSVAGSAAHLVRSVTHEPLLGHLTRRTQVGYDYKDPHFDPQARAFAGFGRVTVTPLDASTGDTIRSSTSTVRLSAQRDHARGGDTHLRTIDNSTGAPVSEELRSYVGAKTAAGGPSPVEAHFSAPARSILVEFPHELAEPAILDVGFDGRSPLANRANRAMPPPRTSAADSAAITFDATLPTGGGMHLNGAKAQWLEYTSPHYQAPETTGFVKEITIEVWLSPSNSNSRGAVVRHGGEYELAIESTGEVRFGIFSPLPSLGWKWVSGGPLPAGRWSHVVASYDGGLPQGQRKLRIFVNGVLKGEAEAAGTLLVYGKLGVGCGWDTAAERAIDCFNGKIGELRIYPEAWASPARISHSHVEYQLDRHAANFGMLEKTWDQGDTTVDGDDVYEELSYAVPQGGGKIRDAVATRTRRAVQPYGAGLLEPVPAMLRGYLGHSETNYDGLPLGQVAAGNPTRSAVYSGPSGVPDRPAADTVTRTRYTNPNCPGVATETEDPLGAVTKTTYDATCAFPLTVANAIGHVESYEYFGVNGAPYLQDGLGGLYGQTKSVTDANGARTRSGYDEWGRPTATVGPYETAGRPGTTITYADAQCRMGHDHSAPVVGCDSERAIELSSPVRETRSAWDDIQDDYRTSYVFADGQTQTEVVNAGRVDRDDWLIAGTQDYDALGRVTASYKPRYLSETGSPTTDRCPDAGIWCDSERLQGDPLRDKAAVARVQTAYDSRGRVIRIYGPNVPPCGDPSARNGAGQLLCDIKAEEAAPKGHFTRFEYPAPGVVRTIDARGVPSVVRRDVQDRVEWVEEYTRASSQPYSTAHYTYDRDGRVVATTDSHGNTTAAAYEALGRKTSTTDPDMGTWAYEYDKRGQLLTQEDAAGALTKNQYDLLGRLVRTEYYTPPKPVKSMCEVKVSQKIPEIVHEIPWERCGLVGPGETPEHPIYVCSRHPGSGPGPWGRGAQFTNQKTFTSPSHEFRWEDVALTPLSLVAGDHDNGVALLRLPFDFALAPTDLIADGDRKLVLTEVPKDARWQVGHPVFVSTNGKIGFPASLEEGIERELASPDNTALPAAGGGGALYPLWDDLVMSGGISYAVTGQAPARRLIVQWDGNYQADPERRVLFRAALSEDTYAVEYQYHTLDLGSAGATIGLQYPVDVGSEAEAVEYSFDANKVGARQSITSLHGVAVDPMRFNAGVPDSAVERLQGEFAFDVDLTDVKEAELSFKHSWNTRCAGYPAGACPVDALAVMALAEGQSDPIPLLTSGDLTLDEALNAGTESMDHAPTVRASIPDDLLGRRATLVFSFDAVEGAPAAGFGWTVDDIGVTTKQECTKHERELEDVVERRYDSAGLTSAYMSSNPVLDLTFDVPGIVEDRSPLHNALLRSSGTTRPDMGVSGKALRFGAQASLEFDSEKVGEFGRGLSVEAWIKPLGTGTREVLVHRSGEFALAREASGELSCNVLVNGTPEVAASAVTVPTDTWTHVAMTYDGADLRCYVNGAEDGVQSVPGALTTTLSPINIGDQTFQGTIDEVRVFATARTAAEVLAAAQAPHRHGPPRGNVLDLRFANPGALGEDSSGAANNADAVQAPALPGIEGTALRFSGDPGQYVRVPDTPSLQSESGELTAEVWVKTDGAQEDRLLVGKWSADHSQPGWRLTINDFSGQVRFEVKTQVWTPDTWMAWSDDTTGRPAGGHGWCGSSETSPTASKLWVAPATGGFAFTTVGGATWDTVVFVRDADGNQIACNDDQHGTRQSSAVIFAEQGEAFHIFASGNNGASGPFTMKVMGPETTATSFITYERIDDGRWHHIAGVYDRKSLKIFIDGKRALRTCKDPETGANLPCRPLPVERCRIEWVQIDNHRYPNAICARGSIANDRPVFAGNYDPTSYPDHPSLEGMLDEVRVSNYPKRDFEMAGSARPYSAYTAALGREVEVRNRAMIEEANYDLLGRNVTVHKTPDAVPGASLAGTYIARSAYDNLGRVAALRHPDGEVVVSGYDKGGAEVSQVGYGNFEGYETFGKQPYLLEADVTSTDRVARLRFGNGVESRFIYDEGPTKNPTTGAANTNATFGNELLSRLITTLPRGETLQHQSYEYDPVGNLLKREDFASQPPPPAPPPPALHPAPLLSTYAYDDLSRLTRFETRLGTALAAGGNYTYDAIGNLCTKEGATLEYGALPGVPQCGPAAAAKLPHAVTRVTKGGVTTAYVYDANGRLAQTRVGDTPISTYTRNVPGKITELTIDNGRFAFAYDGNGERVHKVEPTATTLDLFGFYRDSSKGVEKYYFTGDRRVARRVGMKWEEVFWYHPEHLGGTNLMTGADGLELQDAYSEYTPFGLPLSTAANNAGNPPPAGYGGENTPVASSYNRGSGGFQFTGKELDGSGLYYYGARYYDPSTGRFAEPDPIIPDGSTQALNRYSYVLNNPLKYVDPTGHNPLKYPMGMDLKEGYGWWHDENNKLRVTLFDDNAPIYYILDAATRMADWLGLPDEAVIQERIDQSSILSFIDQGNRNMNQNLANLFEIIDAFAGPELDEFGNPTAFEAGLSPGHLLKLVKTSVIGRQAHKQILAKLRKAEGWLPEVTLEIAPGVTVRKDGFRLSKKGPEVLIIKPDTPTGRLAAEARAWRMERAGYRPRIKYYNPADPAYLPGSPTYIP